MKLTSEQSKRLCVLTAAMLLIAHTMGASDTNTAALESSAAAGDVSAQFELGKIFAAGKGVERDEVQAASWFKRAAEGGSAEAQTNYAAMLFQGQGLEKDQAEAVRLYEKAASNGAVLAQFTLAQLYERGIAVETDPAKSLMWFEKAGEAGLTAAQAQLGRIYLEGNATISKDYSIARKWLDRAAGGGDAWSQNALGVLYEQGLGGEVDPDRARDLYLSAAGSGDPKAQSNYGRMLIELPVGDRDLPEAFKWLTLSERQGEITGAKLLAGVTLEMSEAELAEGRRRVEKFNPEAEAK